MVQGGLAYNFDHDAFSKAGGFDACPAPGKGILFPSGMGLTIGSGSDGICADGVLTVQPSDSFYEMLLHVILEKADLKGRMRYYHSDFDGEAWGKINLNDNQVYLEASEHSTGIHVDSGSWYFHVGTEDNPVKGHLIRTSPKIQKDPSLNLGD